MLISKQNTLEVRQVDTPIPFSNSFLFHRPVFQDLKTGLQAHFSLIKSKKPIASISFYLDSKSAISGYKASFGSFSLQTNVTNDDLSFFISGLEIELLKKNIDKIMIKHWPADFVAHDPVPTVLHQAGYHVAFEDIDQYLPIKKEEFSKLISYNERKKLNQCHRKNFHFKPLGKESLDTVYSLITDSRKRKNYPVTMSLSDLKLAIDAFPLYHLFGVFDDSILVAAAVSVRIRHDILYNLYHADHDNYQSISPTVFLLEGIYNYCQQLGISILDLGISTKSGATNKGLFRFKENVGCVPTTKSTFTKDLTEKQLA